MTPEELLRRYPREAVRWLRDRTGLRRAAFAMLLVVAPESVRAWERGTHPPAPIARARLAALLAPHLATPEGEVFARSLGRGEASEA